MSLAVPNGIGKHQDTLSLHQIESLQKALYSADILLVLVSVCVQASILVFLHDLTPNHLHRRSIRAMASFVTLFFIPSFFVAVFPCHPPHVWIILGVQCIDQLSFWEAFAGVNLVVESALILFPVIVVYPLAIKRRRKAIVISCFAARLMYVFSMPRALQDAHQVANDEKRHRSFRDTVIRSPNLEIARPGSDFPRLEVPPDYGACAGTQHHHSLYPLYQKLAPEYGVGHDTDRPFQTAEQAER